jgi:precorrin-3B synthase
VSAAPHIKGWCPSAWRPMLSGDGYLARLHFSCGIMSSQQARTIALLARDFGNGLIDLTRRANLQIRGVSQQRIPRLQQGLLANNLIAEDARDADMPNVIASPLAGHDRKALIDVRPLVRELEARLAADPLTHGLSAKFCIAIEDGGRFSLRDVSADLAFEACEQRGVVCFAVRLGDDIVAFIEADKLAETALAFAAAFTRLAKPSRVAARRMRDLVDEVGADAILDSCPALGRASTRAEVPRRHLVGGSKPGHDVVGLIGDNVFGVAAPFGSFDAEQFAGLAGLADDCATGELRLTPWRTILIPGVDSTQSQEIAAKCASAGLITSAADPRRRVEACAGAPACTSASINTRGMAAALAPLVRAEETLHVSGCAKGCASSAAATVTLVGREGRFDFVPYGTASGAPVLFGLSPAEARIAVQRLAAENLLHV